MDSPFIIFYEIISDTLFKNSERVLLIKSNFILLRLY